jgi:hypothetical protein
MPPPQPASAPTATVAKITRTVDLPLRTSNYIEREMTPRSLLKLPHRHARVTTVFVGQRSGIPYELERTTCSVCRQVLAERPLRRAAA